MKVERIECECGNTIKIAQWQLSVAKAIAKTTTAKRQIMCSRCGKLHVIPIEK